MLSRFTTRPLNRLLAGHGLTVTEFQVMLLLREGPMRAVRLSRRLRLDPAPAGRALAKLEERGLVRQPLRWRFAEWALEERGLTQLELLEPGGIAVNEELRWWLGPDLSAALVRVVDRFPNPLPREHEGWSD